MKNVALTERLVIQEASLHDSLFFLELLNSPNWIEFIGDRGVKTEKQASDYIEGSLINSYKKHGFGLFKMCLAESLTPIGLCGFVQRDYLNQPDIGFAILPEYEGKGYTFEACQAVMEYGTDELKLDSILGITTASNFKSRRLLTKIGLTEVGSVKPPKKDQEFLLYSNKKSHPNEQLFR